jgi:hypothetical protein
MEGEHNCQIRLRAPWELNAILTFCKEMPKPTCGAEISNLSRLQKLSASEYIVYRHFTFFERFFLLARFTQRGKSEIIGE